MPPSVPQIFRLSSLQFRIRVHLDCVCPPSGPGNTLLFMWLIYSKTSSADASAWDSSSECSPWGKTLVQGTPQAPQEGTSIQIHHLVVLLCHYLSSSAPFTPCLMYKLHRSSGQVPASDVHRKLSLLIFIVEAICSSVSCSPSVSLRVYALPCFLFLNMISVFWRMRFYFWSSVLWSYANSFWVLSEWFS